MDLRELRKKIAARDALEAELETLHKREGELNERMRREGLNLEYEESDVKALEGNTLKSLFYTVIGKKEELLCREEDEAAAAREQYEATRAELDGVRDRIKRIEIELRGIKRAEADYKKYVRDLSEQIETIEPRMTASDAETLAILRRELAELGARQTCYARVTEAGKELLRSVASVEEALRELAYSSRHESYFAEQEHRDEVEARRRLAYLQAERFSAVLSENAELVGDRCIDPTDLDSTIRRAMIRTYSNAPAADRFVPDVPSLALNARSILNDVEKRSERLLQHRADMEQRLSALLAKYQET